MAYPDASFGSLGVAEPDAGHAVGFPVEEDDVGDGGDLGAFFADVLFDVEDGGGVFLFDNKNRSACVGLTSRQRFELDPSGKGGWIGLWRWVVVVWYTSSQEFQTYL